MRNFFFLGMMTGDGSDELFLGYNFMLKKKDLRKYLDRMYRTMRFSSNKIGENLGIDIKQPFLVSHRFTPVRSS
jgi:asparagine synthetase B (glutamine-hydrolysing)